VKVQKILSVVFILMVLLSSTGYTSPNDFMVEPDQSPTELGSHISEDSDVDLLEFRQVISLHVSQSTRVANNLFHEANQLVFGSVRSVQANSFLRKRLSEKPTVKIFIDHGILLI
jgi:hypothetical protein